MKLALSMLCENPRRRTGLTTLFHEFVRHALMEFPDVHWLVFAGPEQLWTIEDPRVEVYRHFPANNRLLARLWADHFKVGPAARRLGAAALFTVGFGPLRAPLPVAMQVVTLPHHGSGGLRRFYRTTALGRGLRRAAVVVANSAWTAEQLRAMAPHVTEKLITSFEGLAHQQFQPTPTEGETARLRAKHGVPERYLLWSGNFYHYKQAEKLIAAYALLTPEQRARLSLVMMGGEWDGGRERAKTLARALGVADTTKFLGWVGDEWLAPLYRQARAHVLPSAEETFGKSVTEAMACGCACVINDIAVLREVAGGAARVIDFGDLNAAACVLMEIEGDDALIAQLRAAGLRRAADFSYTRLARERVGAILEFLDEQRP